MQNNNRPYLASVMAGFLIWGSSLLFLSTAATYYFRTQGIQNGVSGLWLPGEAASFTLFWSIVFIVLGISLLKNSKIGYFLILACIPIRFVAGLTLYGFHLFQLAWITIFIILITPKVSAFYMRSVDN